MKVGKGRSGVMIFPLVVPGYGNPSLNLDLQKHKHFKEQLSNTDLSLIGTVPSKRRLLKCAI